jgi:thiopeptide-type bacteriocin biosynthesis protein
VRPGTAGPSGARLLGRFAHGDARLAELIRAHLAAEEALDPDALFAEVVHLPEGRIGNVLLRPVLRGFEIPYLAPAAVAPDQVLPLDDLLVSVRGGKVVLRSRRLGRRVVPRLTTAHNYGFARNLGPYRMLCTLQEQGVQGAYFSWGALESAAFLPRVTIGRTTVAGARWTVEAADLKRLGEGSAAARFRAAQALRARLELPRRVALVDYDNELPVDLDDALSVDTFAQLVKDRPAARLVELARAEELCARGPEGSFTHELLVPFVRGAVRAPVEKERPRPEPGAARRSFTPGAEWSYARIYAGTSSVDELLRALAPRIAALQGAGAIDRWFFLRYGDPDFHLRLRLHGDPARLEREARPAVEQAAAQALDAGLASRVEWGTYDRELERYGGAEGIELAERLFHADSEAVLGIVQLLEGDAGADARWRLTLRGMDQLLDDLGFDLDGKRRVIELQRTGWVREFNFVGPAERQLGDRFRALRLSLEVLLDRARDEESDLQPGFALFAERSQRLKPVGEGFRAATGRIGVPLEDLAGSFLHMHANRLLRSAHRAQELLLYDFLDRLYLSQHARAKRR